MPSAVVDRIVRVFGSLAGKRVAVLGAAYRGAVKETAFSGVFPVIERLQILGAHVTVHDPLFSDDELANMGFTPFHRGESADVVVVQADHAEYTQWSPQDVPGATLLVDGRGTIEPQNWEPLVQVLRIGKPSADLFRKS